jgi:hypothetical protein
MLAWCVGAGKGDLGVRMTQLDARNHESDPGVRIVLVHFFLAAKSLVAVVSGAARHTIAARNML